MNTSYETVFAEFKDKITDPDLITFAEELQTEMLTAYMKKAIGKCNFRSSVRSHHPLIIQSLHALKKTATCRKRHLIGSQLDGKRLVLITQV